LDQNFNAIGMFNIYEYIGDMFRKDWHTACTPSMIYGLCVLIFVDFERDRERLTSNADVKPVILNFAAGTVDLRVCKKPST